MSKVQYSPACKVWEPDKIGDPREFPIVATTYRVCEHWQAGAMTRNMSWLVELVPDLFIEMSPDLARRKGIGTGDWVRVRSKRGEMRVRALVTNRFEPFFVQGTLVDQIGIPWHWGYAGLATGRQREPADRERGGSQHHDPRVQGVPLRRREGLV